jgi:hypothetical protein
MLLALEARRLPAFYEEAEQRGEYLLAFIAKRINEIVN